MRKYLFGILMALLLMGCTSTDGVETRTVIVYTDIHEVFPPYPYPPLLYYHGNYHGYRHPPSVISPPIHKNPPVVSPRPIQPRGHSIPTRPVK